MRIGIIGTSGKVSDRHLLSKKSWLLMKARVAHMLKEFDESEQIVLVSGGSSWADHMAVDLYLEQRDAWAGLELYLPAPLSGNGVLGPNYVTSPPHSQVGRTLNARHTHFSAVCYDGDKGRSLRELWTLAKTTLAETTVAEPERNSSCKIIVEPRGFKARNSLIAQNCDVLVALTVRDKVEGGTLDTWQKFGKGSSQRHQLIFADE